MSLGGLRRVEDTMSGNVVSMEAKGVVFGRVGWCNRDAETMGRIYFIDDRDERTFMIRSEPVKEEGIKSEGDCQLQITTHDIRA